MEFRKMVTITLYVRQQKRHRYIEQSFGLCGRGRGWDDLGEWHWNMCNIICETNHQSRFCAWYRMLGAGALEWPRGMVWGGTWEGGSGWGTRVHLWQIHVDVWQNQYNIVKLKKKSLYSSPSTLKSVFPPFFILHSFLRITKISPIFVPLNRQCLFFEYYLRFSLSLVFKNWVVMWLFVVFFMFILLESLRLLGSVSYSSTRLEKFQPLFLQMFFWPHFILSFWDSNYKYVTLLDFVLQIVKALFIYLFLILFYF